MSIDFLANADSVIYNLNFNQKNEQTLTSRLSSGLRIQSAADDPSGYTISQTLQTKVNGLQQAASNVQNANNALTVASSALTSVQDILQRVRSLVVESRSDLNSNGQLQMIQTEIDQLLLQVNKIGQSTNFNGQSLLGGAFDTSLGSAGTVTQVASPDLTPSGDTTQPNVVDETGAGNDPGPLVTGVQPPIPGFSGAPGLFVVSVIGYSANATDPDSGTNVGPADYVEVQEYSTSGVLGSTPEYTDISAVPINNGQIAGTQIVFGSYLLQAGINIANLTPADVGTSIAFEVTGPTTAGSGQPLTVNDGGSEGTTVGINLPTISTLQLQLSGISVLRPDQAEIAAGSAGVGNPVFYDAGQDSSNNLATYDAEWRVDNAIQSIGNAQAQVGAQMVSLNEDSSNDNTAIVNYQASASSITDLNVGQATTDYTREQIITQVGMSVLSQMQIHSQQLTQTLFANL